MKKLSILFITLIFMLVANNSFATDPECGVWLASPGTAGFTLSSDFEMRPGKTPAESMAVSALCSGFCGEGTLYDLRIYASTCDERTFGTQNMFPYVVMPDCGVSYMREVHAMKFDATNGITSLGTMIFMDMHYNFGPACPFGAAPKFTADIVEADVSIIPKFGAGLYTSAQTGQCDVDLTGHPIANPNKLDWEAIVTGAVQGMPSNEYTEVVFWLNGDLAVTAPVPSPGGWFVSGNVETCRIEVNKPLRSDLDGDGTVTLIDFGIFKSEYGKTPSCGCGNYWPGQAMP